MSNNDLKTVYDWILEYGQQVDFSYNTYLGWFRCDMAEEYAQERGLGSGSPNHKQLNGVVLTFEMLEKMKKIELPKDALPFFLEGLHDFWYRLYGGEYSLFREKENE